MSAPAYAPAYQSTLQTGGANPLLRKGSKVDLRISGYKLLSQNTLPPEAFVVVFCRNFGKSDWIEVNRSEPIRSCDPQFSSLFSIDYDFAVYQEVRIVAFEKTKPTDDLRQQRLIGVTDSTLGRVLSARGRGLELELTNAEAPSPPGRVIVSAETVMAASKEIILDLGVSDLMTPEEAHAEQNYLNQMAAHVQAAPPPKLARRGAAAMLGRLRKDAPPPAALPAHLANQAAQQQQKHADIQQQMSALQAAPPAFAPFFVISRAPLEANAESDYYAPHIPWTEVARSQPVHDHPDLSRHARVPPFAIGEYELCEGNEQRLLKISVVKGGAGTGAVVGETVTSLYALRRMGQGGTGTADPLPMQPKGRLTVHDFREDAEGGFAGLVQGGRVDFSLVVGVDFTSSNGDPTVPGTCHYNAPPGMPPAPNQYEAAIRTVGNILASYSSNPSISAFGFGANLPPAYATSHCFPVTEQALQDSCDGVEGLVRAYKATLGKVQLAGPTIFSEVLHTAGTIASRRVEAAARAGHGSLPYTVMLILTDGVISDYDASVAQLIGMSSLPISVVIIGIGSEDFRKMKQLDEMNPLRRGTVSAKRDIVQFVPFREFKGDLAALAECVLGRLPEQVMSYVTKVQGQV